MLLIKILMQKIVSTLKPSCFAFCGTLPVPPLILTHRVTPLSLLIHPKAVLQLLFHVKGSSLFLTSCAAFPQESELSISQLQSCLRDPETILGLQLPTDTQLTKFIPHTVCSNTQACHPCMLRSWKGFGGFFSHWCFVATFLPTCTCCSWPHRSLFCFLCDWSLPILPCPFLSSLLHCSLRIPSPSSVVPGLNPA